MASELYADEPAARLRAAGRLRRREQGRLLAAAAANWPANSPGSVNAWLLLVTTKPPTWRDPYVLWRDAPPTLGQPHEGFFYPDPLGFWAEVRHWATVLTALPTPDALSCTTLVHGAVDRALELMRPHVVLCLDEPAWQSAALDAGDVARWYLPDPHRAGQLYEGWWGRTGDGRVVGKSPQHPAAHRLYRRGDMDEFLTKSAQAPSTSSPR